MKAFLSWSGDRSRHVAEALRNWLPKVLQAVKPWMSDEDITMGTRWSAEIAAELEDSKVGIICVTPENQHNPWVMFEAGAISKTFDQTYVCPYLFDLSTSGLSGPLAQFQAGLANKDGTSRILQTLNRALGESQLSPSELEEIFQVWWPRLERDLLQIPAAEQKPMVRSAEEILEEILSNTREQLRREEIRLDSLADRESEIGKFMTRFEEMFSSMMMLAPTSQLPSGPTFPVVGEQNLDIKADAPANFGPGQVMDMLNSLKGIQERDVLRIQDLINGGDSTDFESEKEDL